MDQAAENTGFTSATAFKFHWTKLRLNWTGHILPSGWAGNMSLLTNVYQELRSWKLPESHRIWNALKSQWGSFRDSSGQLLGTSHRQSAQNICTQSGCEFAHLYLRRTTARPVVGLFFCRAVWSEQKDSKQGSKHPQICPERYLFENNNESYLKLLTVLTFDSLNLSYHLSIVLARWKKGTEVNCAGLRCHLGYRRTGPCEVHPRPVEPREPREPRVEGPRKFKWSGAHRTTRRRKHKPKPFITPSHEPPVICTVYSHTMCIYIL